MKSGFYNEGGSSTQNNFNRKNPFKSNRQTTLDFGVFNEKENKKSFSEFVKFAKRETKKYTNNGKRDFEDMFKTFRRESKDSTENFEQNLVKSIRSAKREIESLSQSINHIDELSMKSHRDSTNRLNAYSRQYSNMVRKRIEEEKSANKEIQRLRDNNNQSNKSTNPRPTQNINDLARSSNRRNTQTQQPVDLRSERLYNQSNNNRNTDNENKNDKINTLKSVFTYAWNQSSGPTNFFRSMSEAFTEFADNSSKTGTTIAGMIGSVLSSMIDKLITILTNRFFQGVDNISSTYENTYHDIAVLTNTNQSNYKQAQDDLVDALKKQSLDNNISLSEITKQYSDNVLSGIVNAETAQTTALQDVISKKISPLINTQTDAYKDMQLSMGDKFVDTVNGISQSINQGTDKSNRFISKNFDSLLTDFQPVIMSAKEDYAMNNIAGLAEALQEAEANGATQEQLSQMKQDAYDLQYNRYNMLTSGNTADAMKAIAANEADPTGQNLTAALTASTDAMKSWTNEIINNSDNITIQQAGFVNSGLDTRSALLYNNLADDTTDKMRSRAEESENTDYKSLAESAAEKESNNDNTTANSKVNSTVENFSKNLSQFKQDHPLLYESGEDLVHGLGDVLKFALFQAGANKLSSFIRGGTAVASTAAQTVSAASGTAETVVTAGDAIGDVVNATNDAVDTLSTAGDAISDTVNATDNVADALSAADDAVSNTTKAGGGLLKTFGKIMTAVQFGMDAYGGYKNANDNFKEKNNGEEATMTQTAESTLASMAAGSGPGLFDEGSGWDKFWNILGNTSKYATIGTAAGPIGTLVGAGAGLLTSVIGAKNIANAMDTAGNAIDDSFDYLNSHNIFGEEVKKNKKKTPSNNSNIYKDYIGSNSNIDYSTNIYEDYLKSSNDNQADTNTSINNGFDKLIENNDKNNSTLADSYESSMSKYSDAIKSTIDDSLNTISESTKQIITESKNITNLSTDSTTAQSMADVSNLLNNLYSNLVTNNKSSKSDGNESSVDMEKALKDSAQYIVKAIKSINETLTIINSENNKVVDKKTGLVSPKITHNFSTNERDFTTVVPRSI